GAVSVVANGAIDIANNAAGAAYGINARNAGNGSIDITTNGNITTHNALGAGIYALGGTGVVVVSNTGPKLASSADGIYAQSGGRFGIDSYKGQNITSAGNSIYARSTGGNVKVGNVHGSIAGNISSLGGNGIVAAADPGTAEVDNAAKITAGT